MTYPNGREVEYGYGDSQSQNIDEVVDYLMSRLETISDSSGTLASYKYLGAGRIAVEDYAQSQVKLDYDPDGDNSFAGLDRFGRIHDQVWEQYHLEGGNEVVDGAVDEYIYGYDRAGNRVSKSNELDHDLDETYVYDNVDRLKEWYVGGSQTPSETWTLDSLGNNLGAGDYNAANEETPDTGSSGYDAGGNMIVLRSGNSAIYDAWNRLVEVDDASSNILQRNAYDGTNRRIQIFTNFNGSTPGTVADDYFRGQQVIETRQDAAVQYQYIWSPRYIDAPILRDTYQTINGEQSINLPDRVFYLADANYNVTGLMQYDSGSSTWQPVERYTYTPYGVVTYRDASWAAYTGSNPQSQFSNTILYTGRTLDVSTGLYYYRARFYDALLERFVNRDPIAADVNLYRYCGNTPISDTDPTGQAHVVWNPQTPGRPPMDFDPGFPGGVPFYPPAGAPVTPGDSNVLLPGVDWSIDPGLAAYFPVPPSWPMGADADGNARTCTQNGNQYVVKGARSKKGLQIGGAVVTGTWQFVGLTFTAAAHYAAGWGLPVPQGANFQRSVNYVYQKLISWDLYIGYTCELTQKCGWVPGLVTHSKSNVYAYYGTKWVPASGQTITVAGIDWGTGPTFITPETGEVSAIDPAGVLHRNVAHVDQPHA